MKTSTFSILLFATIFFSFSAKAQDHPDFEITNNTKRTSVKSQDQTGTCWAYTAVSFLESEILRKGGEAYDLSEMYIVRNVYPVKAERYIRFHGHVNFSQGGQAHDALKAFAEHGIVPESAYLGINYKSLKHNHYILAELLKLIADKFAKMEKDMPPEWINHYEAVLDGYFGIKPTEFTYKEKKYSPESFTKQLNINPDDYIEISSYSHHPYYKPFVLELPDNWSHDLYYNVPVDEMMQILKYALSNGYSVAWDGDVSGDGFNHRKGKAELLYDENKLLKENGPQKFRQILFNNFTATDDHLMHLTGLAKDKNGNVWFQTKNSWATSSNSYGGYLYMSENYLIGMTIAFMIHKDALPEDIANKLGL